jgi:hypothetical protein
MWLKQFKHRLHGWVAGAGSSKLRQATRRRGMRLRLEQLEDRCLPSSGTSFLAPVYYPVGDAPVAVAVGDFNNDHIPDLVTADLVNASGDVSVLLGKGDGTFQNAVHYAVGGNFEPQSVEVGDFNGDGNLDIVVANDNISSGKQVTLLLGNGNGTFQSPINFNLPSVKHAKGGSGSQFATSVAVGDFNNDGKLDLAVGAYSIYSTTTVCFKGICSPEYTYHSYVNVLLGDGTGSFKTESTTFVSALRGISVALGDFNGDGKLDVVTTTGGILLGNGDGTLQAPVWYDTSSGNAVALAVGDVNNDGKLDIVAAGSLFFPATHTGGYGVSVLLGNGDGTFQAALPFITRSATGNFDAPDSVALADFNRDGNLDIVTANGNNNNVSVLLGIGNGTFQTNQDYAAGSAPAAVAVGDFKRDGFSDLAVADLFSNMVAVLIDPPATIAASRGYTRARSADSEKLPNQFRVGLKANLASTWIGTKFPDRFGFGQQDLDLGGLL